MSDVFISYSRRDIDFVRHLFDQLKARDRDAWADWQDIPPTADWLAEIYSGIEAANTFLFVISPDLVASAICTLEIEHAVKHNKRLVPVSGKMPMMFTKLCRPKLSRASPVYPLISFTVFRHVFWSWTKRTPRPARAS